MNEGKGGDTYRQHAAGYDVSAQRTMALRLRTIARLCLQPGETVVDAGCGTGLSFAPLLGAVGPQGQVIGIESSPAMIQLARMRVAGAGWTNVQLIEAPVIEAQWARPADALLLNYAHDIIRSPPALDHLLGQARPGARIAVAGIKHPPRWLDPLRLYRRFRSRHCYTHYEGLDTPWDLLAQRVTGLQVETTMMGTGFIAWGSLAQE